MKGSTYVSIAFGTRVLSSGRSLDFPPAHLTIGFTSSLAYPDAAGTARAPHSSRGRGQCLGRERGIGEAERDVEAGAPHEEVRAVLRAPDAIDDRWRPLRLGMNLDNRSGDSIGRADALDAERA